MWSSSSPPTCCTLCLRVSAACLAAALLVGVGWTLYAASATEDAARGQPSPCGGQQLRGQPPRSDPCVVPGGVQPGPASRAEHPGVMRGDRGPGGEKGARGAPGLDGRVGEKGSKGRLGSTGYPGVAGLPGMEGGRGEKGEPGADAVSCSSAELVRTCGWLNGAGRRSGDHLQEVDGSHRLPHHPSAPAASGVDDRLPRTCADLADDRRGSGTYWIDPNAGDANDAIRVHCDLERRRTPKTCLIPTPADDLPPIDGVPAGDAAAVGQLPSVLWMSSIVGGTWLTDAYEPIRHQIPSLQALSRRARQSLTYHCWNSVGRQSPDGSFGRGLRLIGWNEAVIHADPSERLHFESPHDGCKKSTGRDRSPARTEIYFETTHPFSLPLIDVGVVDAAANSTDEPKRFAIVMGRLCFY